MPGQGIVSRIDASLVFAEKLLAANPAYARANPDVLERIKKIKEQNRNYLAHEYFNRDWLRDHARRGILPDSGHPGRLSTEDPGADWAGALAALLTVLEKQPSQSVNEILTAAGLATPPGVRVLMWLWKFDLIKVMPG